MNGVTLTVDGAVVASSAVNNGSYVAMEDTTVTPRIGSFDVATGQFMDGSLAMVAVAGRALTTEQMLEITRLCRTFFGVPA